MSYDFTALSEALERVADASKELQENLKPMNDTFDTLGSKKTQKSTKKIGNLFKQLSGMGTPMSILLEILSGLMVALEPFMIIIDILKGLFEIMGANILPYLMTALQPIMNILLALTPVFEFLGKVVGIVMQIALIPLTVVFKLLEKVLLPLMPLLDPLIKVLDKMSPIINYVTDVIVGLISSMEFWKSIIENVANFIRRVFSALKGFIKNIINGIIRIINFFIDIINQIITSLGFKGIENVRYLQSGGIITSPTLAALGEGGKKEGVIPLEDPRAMEMLGGGTRQEYLLERNNELLEELTDMKRNKYRFESLR